MTYVTADLIKPVITILVIVLIYYGFRFLARVVLPVLLRRFAKKMQDKMSEQFNEAQRDAQGHSRQSFDENENHKRIFDSDDGEYVDYEEVSDK